MKKRTVIAVIFISVLLTSAGCQKPRTDSSSEATVVLWISTKAEHKNEDLTIKTGPLIEILEELKKQAKIEEKVTIRKFSFSEEVENSGTASIERKMTEPGYNINVSKFFYDGNASKVAIRSMLAHELGHLKNGHLGGQKSKTGFIKTTEREQAEADIFAMRLLGRKYYEEGLKDILLNFHGTDKEWKIRMVRVNKLLETRGQKI